ncbi:benzoate 4-monooxygenase cytochrome p450 [Phlyctema vagabunda]|uniref:Benzoate 4-monooxygenase cytochrome p450 n=1 Tax=Phlyctema vagabunda TaxID=108571 RepID=A0ABR4PPQ6_9HELO
MEICSLSNRRAAALLMPTFRWQKKEIPCNSSRLQVAGRRIVMSLTDIPLTATRSSSSSSSTMSPLSSSMALFWSTSAVLYVGIAGLVIAFVVHRFFIWHRLRHIPGPTVGSLSMLWMLRNTMAGQMHLALQKVCDEYGSLTRVGPNELVTSDPETVRRIWAVRSPYRRGNFYDAIRFDPSRDNLLSMRSEEGHTALKAKMAPGYSGKENEALESTIDDQITSFVSLIERKYVSTASMFRPVDFARIVQYFTLDVISDVAFGRPFGFLTTDSDVHDYIKMTEESMPIMMFISVNPWIANLIQTRLFSWLLPSEKDRLGFGKFISVAKSVVAERFGENKVERKDMLGSFIRNGLTQEEAGSETLLQIIAGSDTTATAIRATLLHLMSTPSAYNALQAEIDNGILAGNISSPATDAEGRRLPFLQAVIKEGLRIWPPVTGLMSKTVPKGGDILNGVFVPGGTEVGYCAWGLQRIKSIYGEDADVFRPERWLDPDPDRVREMEKTVELVFVYGKWQCPGKSVAAIELNKVFIELFRRFDFALVNPSNPWKTSCAGIHIQSDLFVRVTKRA